MPPESCKKEELFPTRASTFTTRRREIMDFPTSAINQKILKTIPNFKIQQRSKNLNPIHAKSSREERPTRTAQKTKSEEEKASTRDPSSLRKPPRRLGEEGEGEKTETSGT